MVVHGAEFAMHELTKDLFEFKMIAHEKAVCFFPTTTEHRDFKQPGISYEDDSMGNALAAMIKPGKIEFRRHSNYSVDRVAKLGRLIRDDDGVPTGRDFAVFYQGEEVVAAEHRPD